MVRIYTVLIPWMLASAIAAGEDVAVSRQQQGEFGGVLRVAERSEPKTLNPLIAVDVPSRDVIRRIHSDLITIDRETQQVMPGLAKSWKVADRGRTYTLELRRGLKFSDGAPFDADDVIFSFRVYLDPKVSTANPDLQNIGGKPPVLEKVSRYAVRMRLKEPYAAVERIFDSVAILPRHLLEKEYLEGRLAQAWGVGTDPGKIAGLGPFRLKMYTAGKEAVIERNPYYWKVDSKGKRLPYLDEIVFRFTGNEDAQVLRLLAGELDIVQRMGPANYQALEKDPQASRIALMDLGPSLETNILFFNWNGRDETRRKWFRDVRFRQAVSQSIDREAMVRLVYGGRAAPLSGLVSVGNRVWMNERLSAVRRNIESARQLLREAGFRWNANGQLVDSDGRQVEFTISTSSSSNERTQMATIMQEDLARLGMRVRVVPLEFRSLLDRVLRSKDYDACVFGLGGGDPDPIAQMNVLLTDGGLHLWNLSPGLRTEPWEQEIDRLMKAQLTTMRIAERKQIYDKVQDLVARYLPVIGLVSPNVLLAASKRVKNLRPAVMDDPVLWNAEAIYIKALAGSAN
jgi:peptide/nickel transport system substrate-binding protein